VRRFTYISLFYLSFGLLQTGKTIQKLSFKFGNFLYEFLHTYIYSGAVIVSIFAFTDGIFLVPKASERFKTFVICISRGGGQSGEMRENSNVFRQISKIEYICVSGLIMSLK
jgi:hypothetical protein